jgi:HEAT repeat protein
LSLVLEALHDEEPHVRQSAVAAAWKIDSPKACEALARVSSDEDWEVRVYAAEVRKQLDCARDGSRTLN